MKQRGLLKRRTKDILVHFDRNAIFVAGLLVNASWEQGNEQIIPYTRTFEEMTSLLHMLRYIGIDTDTVIYAWEDGEIVECASEGATSYSCCLQMPQTMISKRLNISRKVHTQETILTAIPFAVSVEGEQLILQSPSRSIVLRDTHMRTTEHIKGSIRVTEKTIRSRVQAIHIAVIGILK